MSTFDAEYKERHEALQQISSVSVKDWIIKSPDSHKEKMETIRIAVIVERIMRNMFDNELREMNKNIKSIAETNQKMLDLWKSRLTSPGSESAESTTKNEEQSE